MELDTLKIRVFHWAGWISVIIGLFALAILNITLLSGYDTPFSDRLSLFIFLSLLFGAIACLQRMSRTLGLWGIFLAFFLILFMGVMFLLGWFIIPFP
ncbi:hypothetical protein [Lysinibacillus odysseyi]|uniref:Uncharacterized protein n=1 Tax=Lysinibacillus odysseyi 34hs-1 = NBRC 100172 TaxID=1220589 RepID=A0A0A3IJY0_9BACI|nr:hypothetical protein [Lysinibacillus odysseyi]KGR85066.1 hypothetical protein CD32_11525 [Lysinibacillus odysseyi 34hs-1 = NBRC 100172]